MTGDNISASRQVSHQNSGPANRYANQAGGGKHSKSSGGSGGSTNWRQPTNNPYFRGK